MHGSPIKRLHKRTTDGQTSLTNVCLIPAGFRRVASYAA
jgi:hypothetical protein